MTHSLNEIEALSKRAARGSGLSWGLSEEAAKGTRWLAAFGLPGPELLGDLLELNDRRAEIDVSPVSLEGIWTAPAGRMSPLIAGASLSDCASRLLALGEIRLQSVSYPLLAVPFLAGAALRLGQPVSVAWDDVAMVTDGYRLAERGGAAVLAAHTAMMRVSAPAEMPEARAPLMRARVSDQGWARLCRFAQRTLAPATEESRRRGAGAAETDND